MMAGIVPTSITESANLADIDWKERCITLESQMNKFKTQATKIRDVLGEKMEELEQNVKTSTERAEKAEQQVIELQEKLSATKSHSAINNDDGDGDGIGILKECCKEKDEIIQNLETQIDEQRRLRHHESKLVETKAAKIKEWVTTKLESLEQENQQLRSANTESMEAIRKLQTKVDMYESNNSRRSIGVQYRPLSTAMEPSDLIERPSSLGMKEKKQDGSDPVLNVPWSPVHALIEAQRSRSESQATNTNNIESGKKGHTWPKRKLLNKSNSKELQVFDIDFSSQGKFEEARGLEESSDVADLNEPLYETLRTTKRENKLSAQPTLSVESPESSTGTPPMSVSPLTEESPPVANTGSPPLSMSPTFTANNTNSDLYAVPRKYKQSSSSSSSAGLSDGKEPYDNDIDDETGEPPMLPHRMTNIDIISIIEDDDIESETREGKMKPPTPPHRLPSWEDRIISMAASGMNLSQENLSLSVEDSDTAIYQTSEVSHTNQLYQEMQPPVYTILKGRAVQIRSTPYSGDSSDSDNDENSATSSMVTTSPTSVSMAMSLSSPKKSRTSTANKRGVSIQSNSSEGDYCMPPDAAPIMEDTEEYEQKFSKTTQPDSPRSTKDILEKSGYLTKLGGKVKSWKKRWFVLHNGQLVYYKSKNDVSNKPLGQVPLDGKCKVMKSESSHSFEIVTSQRTYYLSAESNNAVDEWIQALQGVVSFQDGTYWDCSDNHGVMKGWLVKVKHGQHRKCWCMLVGKTLTSYKTPTDKIALESIDLQGKRVEEIDSRLNSDLLGVQKQLKYRVVIHFSSSNNQEPVYLLFSTKEDKVNITI
ncbi:pleckstrin homology domain-containing family H member 2-like [Saccoglossus kowalevskii]|uniref:Pleckstrin homology domain-containing family H member 2-like n=1 Tax=Saccoglossus kowalevskii TaxID=10224 RepID=A0ABM0GQN6_SACKO|nr:PREDICTED: pleckstrin homology domain-containing family H member 2-like [Saccoglossus kowalevskii]